MTKKFIITGTDTGIGKTTVAAMLTDALDGAYWKPIQSGTVDGTDRDTVRHITGLPDDRLPREAYILSQPLSPHRAAELDGVSINTTTLTPPVIERPLIIEGAGGLLVPITRDRLQIDLFAAWQAPVILCARTALGTINQTLLSVAALRAHSINLHGLIFIGEDNPDNIRTIADFSGARVLGHVPHLPVIDRAALRKIFAARFRREDFI